MESKRHSVTISEENYRAVKQFCEVNDLRVGNYIDELIEKYLLVDMYGNVPFGSFSGEKKEEKEPVVEVKEVMGPESVEVVIPTREEVVKEVVVETPKEEPKPKVMPKKEKKTYKLN